VKNQKRRRADLEAHIAEFVKEVDEHVVRLKIRFNG
jgi:hypothetical protein